MCNLIKLDKIKNQKEIDSIYLDECADFLKRLELKPNLLEEIKLSIETMRNLGYTAKEICQKLIWH
jgi:hypothetical protein